MQSNQKYSNVDFHRSTDNKSLFLRTSFNCWGRNWYIQLPRLIGVHKTVGIKQRERIAGPSVPHLDNMKFTALLVVSCLCFSMYFDTNKAL